MAHKPSPSLSRCSLDLACVQPGGPGAEEEVEVSRLKVPGAPVFSLAKMPTLLPDGTVYKQRRTRPPGIFMGTHNKEVVTWMLGSNDVTDKVRTPRPPNMRQTLLLRRVARCVQRMRCVATYASKPAPVVRALQRRGASLLLPTACPPQVKLGNHTGWVRSLAITDKWLFT